MFVSITGDSCVASCVANTEVENAGVCEAVTCNAADFLGPNGCEACTVVDADCTECSSGIMCTACGNSKLV